MVIMIDNIKTELEKPNPDWLLISNMAKDMYLKSQQTNSLGLKKGVVNIIKASEYNCAEVVNGLKKCFTTAEYEYILVGGYSGMTVTKFNKLIPTLNYTEKYIIVVTNKDQVYPNLTKAGIECVLYNAGLRNKYDRDKTTMFHIKGQDVDIKCPVTEIQMHLRDNALEMLLNN
jgi:hypothetical protein